MVACISTHEDEGARRGSHACKTTDMANGVPRRVQEEEGPVTEVIDGGETADEKSCIVFLEIEFMD